MTTAAEARGGAALPEGWERVSVDGPGPFVTKEVLRAPDGTLVQPEQLAGWVLDRLAGRTAPVVVDLGAGSGALALSIAQELARALVVAVVRDPGAI